MTAPLEGPVGSAAVCDGPLRAGRRWNLLSGRVVEDEDEDPARDAIFIDAMRDIVEGEELTYNYGIVLAEAHTPQMKKLWACHCGSKKCTGTMLQPKRTKKKG